MGHRSERRSVHLRRSTPRGQTRTVLAIEADTCLVELLRRSCRLPENADLNVDVLPVAMAGTVGVARFNVANRGRATSYLDGAHRSSQTGGVRETQLVPTVTLDWLLDHFPPPTFVKIDVEGAEHMVLAGARHILSQHKPVILCEVNQNNTCAVSEQLRAHGYRFFDAEASAPERVPLAEAAWNTLAYPPGYAASDGR
jgi:FkbM family methyltransferase